MLSLYTGAGGLDFGFEAAGFRTAVAVEIDADCCRTLRTNRRWPVLEKSIFDVPTDMLLQTAEAAKGEVDLLIGGPPCQPFSKSGYWAKGDAARLADPRANTLSAFMRVVEEALPRAFLLENVEGLAYKGKSEGLDSLLARLKEINASTGSNYRPFVRKLSAASFGVPQLRERVFVVASRSGDEFVFPAPTHFDSHNHPGEVTLELLQPYMTAWDALGDLSEDSSETLKLRGKWADLLASIPEGHNYLWHTPRGGGVPLFGWRTRYWCFLLKLAKARPSWTIQAQPGPATGPFHWNNRRLSARELCRLQTFPDNIEITGSITAVQKQVGNAVPSLLAEVLARSIGEQFLRLPRYQTAPVLLPTRKCPVPAPRQPQPVPAKYLPLKGDHAAHPGTGLGRRATARAGERIAYG